MFLRQIILDFLSFFASVYTIWYGNVLFFLFFFNIPTTTTKKNYCVYLMEVNILFQKDSDVMGDFH